MTKIKGEMKTLIKDTLESMMNKDDRVVAAFLKKTCVGRAWWNARL